MRPPGRRGVNGLEDTRDLFPVLAGGITEGVPQQVDYAGLDRGAGPDSPDRARQALEPVADQHENVVDTAILDFGEDVHPVLGALAAVAGPQPEDVPPALDSDRQDHVDGPVGYRPVPDLDVDSVNEDHGTDGVERSVLPFGHAVEHLVGDRGDRLPGHLGSIDLGQVGLDLTGRQALRRKRDDHLVHAGQTLLPLLDDPRLEAAFPVARHCCLDRADVGQHGLGAGAVA